MKKILLPIMSLTVLLSAPPVSSEENTDSVPNKSSEVTKVESNRTIREMIDEAKQDYNFILSSLEELPDDTPVIAYNGRYFASPDDTKETYSVEIRSENGQELKFKDSDPATVGEIKQAILPYAPNS